MPLELWTVVRRVRAVLGFWRYDRTAAAGVLGPPAATWGAGAPAAGSLPDEASAAAQVTRGGRPVLTAHALARAGAAVAALPPAEADRVRGVLRDASPVLGAYLLSTLAAGYPLSRVEQLATDLAGYADHWLHRHLGLLDGTPGPAGYTDADGHTLPLRQQTQVTCGPTALIVHRALVDPVYALQLTTGGTPGDPARHGVRAVEARFRAEQAAIHHAATRTAVGPLPWPKALGTPPWGAARFLNRLSWVTGVTYHWQPVDTADPEHLSARLRAITSGLALGVPVPLYIGRRIDRHVVLAFGQADGRLLVYEPSRGEVVTVDPDAVLGNRMAVAGWDRLEGVLSPRPASS
jgi:hypothetical protein